MNPPDEMLLLRLQAQRSQQDFAGALGVHPVTLCRWEHGTCRVPPTALRLARLLAAGPHPPTPVPYTPPDAASLGIYLGPADECNWRDADCAGPLYAFSVYLEPQRYLMGDACETHLYVCYDALIVRLRRETERRTTKEKRSKAHEAQNG